MSLPILRFVFALFALSYCFSGASPLMAENQFGDSDQSGLSSTPPDPNALPSQFVQGPGIMALVSPDGKTLAGMGTDVGEWVTVTLKNDSGKAQVIVSTPLAVCKDDESIHALDTRSQEWKSIKLDGDHADLMPIVGNTLSAIQVGNRVYAYGTGAYEWSVLTLPTDLPDDLRPHVMDNYITVYSSEYIHTYTVAAEGWRGVRTKSGSEGGIETIETAEPVDLQTSTVPTEQVDSDLPADTNRLTPNSSIAPLYGSRIIALIAPNKRSLWGYVMAKDKWFRVILSETETLPQVTIGTDIAVCKVGNKVYAFGDQSALWSKVTFPPGEEIQLEVGSGFATAQSENCLYVFSKERRSWSGVALETPGNPQSPLIPAPEN